MLPGRARACGHQGSLEGPRGVFQLPCPCGEEQAWASSQGPQNCRPGCDAPKLSFIGWRLWTTVETLTVGPAPTALLALRAREGPAHGRAAPCPRVALCRQPPRSPPLPPAPGGWVPCLRPDHPDRGPVHRRPDRLLLSPKRDEPSDAQNSDALSTSSDLLDLLLREDLCSAAGSALSRSGASATSDSLGSSSLGCDVSRSGTGTSATGAPESRGSGRVSGCWVSGASGRFSHEAPGRPRRPPCSGDPAPRAPQATCAQGV